jgi:exosortase B
MAAVLGMRSFRAARGLEWLPVAAGLLAVYAPAFYRLANSLWREDDYAHGPLVLCVVVWLIWRRRDVLFAPPGAGHEQDFAGAPAAGFALVVCGLLLYVLGSSQEISLFEIGSLAPVLAGVVVALRGWGALRALWFPLAFVAFMVPLPQVFVDWVSSPLKQQVSALAEQLLYGAGYPVARSGVVLAIGKYQLLIVGACSGLNSMFSLLAVGAFYLHLMRHVSRLHNALIVASLLPIAFCANIVRVIVLVLVTYHFGDAAGQGFLHRFSGMLLFVTALALIVGLDALLSRTIKPAAPR